MKKGLFLVGILLVPSVIYMLFSLGEHHTSRLGFSGAYEIDEMGDTVFKPVIIPAMMDQNGNSISKSTLDGKVVLLNTFRWPCDEACATSLTTLNNYLHKTGFENDWLLLNVCLDSISQAELHEFSEKKLYSGNNWLYASSDDLTQLLTECYINTGKLSSVEELPSTEVVLLDQQQRIRTFFNLRFQKDNKTMEDAIKLLIQEPHISWKEK
ncbi:MAG: hypothetical protein R2813_01835 [Flavobacteriales bacterium]